MRRVFVFVGLFLGSLVLGPALGTAAQEAASTPGVRGTASPIPAASPPVPPVLAEFVREITLGTDSGSSASGVAVDADGSVYVIDALKDHIRVFDRDGHPVATWGERGEGPGQFTFREGSYYWGDLAFGPDGHLYVLDSFNSRVQVLDPDGHFLREWDIPGEERASYDAPTGIGIDAAGHVYVTDTKQLQIFDADGQVLASWDESAAEGWPFGDPSDVAIDAAGVISVTDFDFGKIVRLDPEGTVIATIDSWGAQQQFVRPWGVTVDAAGNLYVAEWTGSRVQVVAPDGAWLGSIGTTGYKSGQFISPIYLAIGPEGLLYVANDMTGRVLVFRLLPPLAPGAGTPAAQ